MAKQFIATDHSSLFNTSPRLKCAPSCFLINCAHLHHNHLKSTLLVTNMTCLTKMFSNNNNIIEYKKSYKGEVDVII